MSQIKIKVACKGATSLPLRDLIELQGNLKSLSEEAYVKLRKGLIARGITFVLHVWKNKGKFHIIDGHQRVRTMRRMETEGIVIPLIPVALVEAKTMKEAKEKVLAGASAYGEMDRDGLYHFMHESDINFSDVNAFCQFSEIDLPKFHAEFYVETVAQSEDPREATANAVSHAPNTADAVTPPPPPEVVVAPLALVPDEPVGKFRDSAPREDKEELAYKFLPEEKQEMLYKCDELMKDFKVLSHAEVIFALVSDAHRKLKAKNEKAKK